jgi:hypothetical protein
MALLRGTRLGVCGESINQPFQLSFVLSLVVRGFSLVPCLVVIASEAWQSHSNMLFHRHLEGGTTVAWSGFTAWLYWIIQSRFNMGKDVN